MISCLHDPFLDGQLISTPHLYFLYPVLIFANLFRSLDSIGAQIYKNRCPWRSHEAEPSSIMHRPYLNWI